MLALVWSAAVLRPEAAVNARRGAPQRATVVIMQQPSRDKLMDELASFEKAAQFGANRRAIITGAVAGTVGAVAGKSFSPDAPVISAAGKTPAEEEMEIAAFNRQITEKEATLQVLAERTATAEAKVKRAEAELLRLEASRMETDNLDASELAKLEAALAQPLPGPSARETELQTKMELAEAQAAAAEARLAQRELEAMTAAIFDAPTTPRFDDSVIVGGLLAVTAVGEAVALVAANTQIRNLEQQMQDAKAMGESRVAYAKSAADKSYQIAQSTASDAKKQLGVVQGHVGMMAKEALDMEKQLDQARKEWPAEMGEPPMRGAAAAPPAAAVSAEEQAKMAWLARHEEPTWGKGSARSTLRADAPSAAPPTMLSTSAPAPPAPRLSEEEAKAAWLARQEQPSWGQGGQAGPRSSGPSPGPRSSGPSPGPPRMWMSTPTAPSRGGLPWVSAIASWVDGDETAKRAWLNKLDTPTRIKPAAAVRAEPRDGFTLAYLEEACGTGDDEACYLLSQQEQTKRAWLARGQRGKLDTLAAAPQADSSPNLSARLEAAASSQQCGTLTNDDVAAKPLSEEEVKQEWISKLDGPAWGSAASAMADVTNDASELAALTAACEAGDQLSCELLSRVEEAKKAWFSRLQVSSWAAAAAAVSAVASMVEQRPAIHREEAKRAFLARLNEPSWGFGSARPDAHADTPDANTPAVAPHKLAEDKALEAWTTRLDAPTWGEAAQAMADVSEGATAMAALTQACAAGDENACSILREDEAKRAYLSRLDVPSWSAVATAVSAIAAEAKRSPWMSAEEIVKQKMLARQNQPNWVTRSIGYGTTGSSSRKLRHGFTQPEDRWAWISRLDAPSWHKAASAMAHIANEASELAALMEACDKGDDMSCDLLLREEKATKEWLAGLDVPSWGAAASAVSDVAVEVQRDEAKVSKENEAKRAWIARMDELTWGAGSARSTTPAQAPATPAAGAIPAPPPAAAVPSPMPRQDSAPTARYDVPTPVQEPTETRQVEPMQTMYDSHNMAATPAWVRWSDPAPPPAAATHTAAPVVPPVAAAPPSPKLTPRQAKEAWLANQGSSAWGKNTAPAPPPVTDDLAIDASMVSPMAAAPPPLKLTPRQAKEAWLANQGSRAWGTASAPSRQPVSDDVAFPPATAMPSPTVSEEQAGEPSALAAPQTFEPAYAADVTGAAAVTPPAAAAEEAVKYDVLAREDTPTSGKLSTSLAPQTFEPAYAAAATPPPATVSPPAPATEPVAKQDALSLQDIPTSVESSTSDDSQTLEPAYAAATEPAAATVTPPAAASEETPPAAAVMPPASASPSPRLSEEAAKKAWISRLDSPTWGKSSTSDATKIAKPTYGAAVSRIAAVPLPPRPSEEQAKQAWLARIDPPTWGKPSTGAAKVAHAAALPVSPQPDEEQAKRAWIERLNTPLLGKSSTPTAAAAPTVEAEVQEAAPLSPKLSEDASTPATTSAATLTNAPAAPFTVEAALSDTAVAPMSPQLSEEEKAKQAWLARVQTPAWGKSSTPAAAPAAMPSVAPAAAVPLSPEASEQEEAKQASLAYVDTPTPDTSSTPAAPAAAPIVEAKVQAAAPLALEPIKETEPAVVARVDTPTFGKASTAGAPPAGTPAVEQEAWDAAVAPLSHKASQHEAQQISLAPVVEIPTLGQASTPAAPPAAVPSVAAAVPSLVTDADEATEVEALVARQAAAQGTEEEAAGLQLSGLDAPELGPEMAGVVAPAVADASAAVTGAAEKKAKEGRRKRRYQMRKARSKFFDEAKEHDQVKVDQKVKATTEAREAAQATAKEAKARADAAQVQREKEHRAKLEAAFKAAEEAARGARAAADGEGEKQAVGDAEAEAAEVQEEQVAAVAEAKEEEEGMDAWAAEAGMAEVGKHASAAAEAEKIVEVARVDAQAELVAKLVAMRQAKIKAKEQAMARAEAAYVNVNSEDKKRRARLEAAAKNKAFEEAKARMAEAEQVKAEKEHRARLEAAAKAKAFEETKARLAEAEQVKSEEESRATAEQSGAMSQRKAMLEQVVTLACSAAKGAATRTPELDEASECAILSWLDQVNEGAAVPPPAVATKPKKSASTQWAVTTKRRAKKRLEWLSKAMVGIVALWTGGSTA
jgi:hypothetical protein